MNVFEREICKLSAEALNFFDESLNWEPSELNALVEQPPNPEMGDYALPCFSFSKIFKISPDKIAEDLSEKLNNLLNSNNYITSIKSVGGIKTFNHARQLAEAGSTYIGTSFGFEIIQDLEFT